MNVRTLEDIERLEKLEELILELKNLSDAGVIIVVEGRKDVESLRSLGVNGEIKLSSQQPLLDFTEKLSRSGKDIVLLTDWDRKGGMVARKIIDYLHAYSIIPNMDLRARIGFLVKKRIKDIESLSKYMGKLRTTTFLKVFLLL